MRPKIILIAVSFAVVSCTNNTAEKPEKLIDQETMEKIIYDISMIQAIKGHDASLLPKNSINPKTYIYQKYQIDSTQFAQSNNYYSSNITLYKKMFDNVIAKIALEKKEVDKKVKKEIDAQYKRQLDSTEKANKTQKTNIIAKG